MKHGITFTAKHQAELNFYTPWKGVSWSQRIGYWRKQRNWYLHKVEDGAQEMRG